MSEKSFKAGVDSETLANRAYISFKTDHPMRMLIGLDKSRVPFSARVNGRIFSLIYDSDYADAVVEILDKVQSDEYDEMLKELKSPDNSDGILILLSSVAYHLHTTDGALKKRPVEVQESLCKLFIDLWFCDTLTIQRELARVMPANTRTEEDMEKPKKYISRKAVRDTAEHIRKSREMSEKQQFSDNERMRVRW